MHSDFTPYSDICEQDGIKYHRWNGKTTNIDITFGAKIFATLYTSDTVSNLVYVTRPLKNGVYADLTSRKEQLALHRNSILETYCSKSEHVFSDKCWACLGKNKYGTFMMSNGNTHCICSSCYAFIQNISPVFGQAVDAIEKVYVVTRLFNGNKTIIRKKEYALSLLRYTVRIGEFLRGLFRINEKVENRCDFCILEDQTNGNLCLMCDKVRLEIIHWVGHYICLIWQMDELGDVRFVVVWQFKQAILWA